MLGQQVCHAACQGGDLLFGQLEGGQLLHTGQGDFIPDHTDLLQFAGHAHQLFLGLRRCARTPGLDAGHVAQDGLQLGLGLDLRLGQFRAAAEQGGQARCRRCGYRAHTDGCGLGHLGKALADCR